MRHAGKQNKRANEWNHATTNRCAQRMPHSELDGAAKHSVYATLAGRTKQGKRAPLIQQHSLDGCAGLAVAPSMKNGMAHAIRGGIGGRCFLMQLARRCA